MTTEQGMQPTAHLARLAGVLYLLIIICGISAEVLVRGSLVVPGDPMATLSNILEGRGLYRTGLVLDVIMLFSDVAIAVLFYYLLRPVSRLLALMAAAFRLSQAMVLAFNLLNYYAPILLLSDVGNLEAFGTQQLAHLVAFYLQMHSHGYDLGLLFFGVSNLILGYLLIRASYFPSLLGYALQLAGLVYLAGSAVRFLAPGALALVQPAYAIPLLVEFAFCLWLIIKARNIHAD